MLRDARPPTITQARLAIFLSLASLISPLSAQHLVDTCKETESQVSLDHVVVMVANLDVASATYRGLGFTLKDGRLHSNGLKNRHLKFVEGTELELMSVVGEPSDEMARRYSEFLRDGEGGAYLALRASQELTLAAAGEIGITGVKFQAEGLRYVTFLSAELGALFFVENVSGVHDPDSLLHHDNGANGIDLVWVEAPAQFGELLLALGAAGCGETSLPDGRVGSAYGVSKGVVVVTSPTNSRPRVQGVVLRSALPLLNESHRPLEAHGISLIISSSPWWQPN